MVKTGLCPAARVVALLALFAQPPFMRIVFLVTGIALCLGLAVFFLLLMTLGALCPGMTVFQRKIRKPVIKSLAVKDNGLVFAPLVLLVALSALGTGGPFFFAVVTAFIFKIKGDLFVTIKAQALLRLLAERPVAVRAIVLVFRMSGDNFTGHEETFYILCPGLSCRKQQRNKEEGGQYYLN